MVMTRALVIMRSGVAKWAFLQLWGRKVVLGKGVKRPRDGKVDEQSGSRGKVYLLETIVALKNIK
jgi:hypothetical protein